jgi:nucleoside-diphosphate-sugar epimerase
MEVGAGLPTARIILLKISALWLNISMQKFNSDPLLTSFAFDYFDRQTGFRHLAQEVGNSSFFITGGSGLFGSWLLSFFDWCVKRKYSEPELTILSRQEIFSTSSRVKYICGDIQNFQNHDAKTTYTLHMAAPSASETFKSMCELNKFYVLANGTKNLLNYAREHTEKRTLILSSGALYGGFDETRVDHISESERQAPAYAENLQALSIGKRVAEFLTKEFCDRGHVDASIARCFGFIGPGLPTNLHYAVGNFVAQAVKGEDIVINGSGKPVRSFMYLGDMVFWIMTILLRGKRGEDYNVGSKEGISILNLANEIVAVLGTKSKIVVLGESDQSSGNPPNYYYVPDTLKAERNLTLFCKVSLRESIKEYAEYLNLSSR